MPSAVDHRPWPLPRRPWAMAMTWLNLLFMHWPVDPQALRPHLPRSLPLDTFDGRAWLGVVPFTMSRTRSRGLPALPTLSQFPELNVRTYVTVHDKPGVYFFSLDAHHRMAVETARLVFSLPYFYARMSSTTDDTGWTTYRSTRLDRRAPAAQLDIRYGPAGAPFTAAPGSLEHFLVERYCLYVERRGRPLRGDIHHNPWPLQPAQCHTAALDMTRLLDLNLPDTPPLLHFAHRLDVVAWLPKSTSAPPIATQSGR